MKIDETEYASYLQSFKWKLVVLYMTSKYPYCTKCNSQKDLQVHHTSYANYPHEKEEDLIVLCKKCHYNHHKDDYQFKGQEEIDFRRISLENIKGEKKWQFNLHRISGLADFLPAKANIFHCEICGNYMSSSYDFPLNKLILTNNGQFISGSFIRGKNPKRKGIRICQTCWDEVNQTCIKTYKLTPKIAKLLLTDPAPNPKTMNNHGNRKIFKMGAKKD